MHGGARPHVDRKETSISTAQATCFGLEEISTLSVGDEGSKRGEVLFW